MDNFATKFDRVFSELQIAKICSSLLRKRIIDLERSSLNIWEEKWLSFPQFLWRYQTMNQKDWFAKRCPRQKMKFRQMILKHVTVSTKKLKQFSWLCISILFSFALIAAVSD